MIDIKVSDVMSPNVIKAKADTSIKEAAKLLVDNEVGSLAIVNSRKIVGMLTDRDFVRMLTKSKIPDRVKDLMSTNIRMINPDEDIKQAARLMGKYRVRHLLVKDKGKIKGIISIRDLLKIDPDTFYTYIHEKEAAKT